MEYKLAKELKDAGFPVGYSHDEGIGHVPNLDAREYEKSYFTGVSLSELIEACGDGFGSIEHFREKRFTGFREEGAQWLAEKRYEEVVCEKCTKKSINNYPRVVGHGDTPEEAVARLWLALNPKK